MKFYSHHFTFNIINPRQVYDYVDREICIVPVLDAAIRIMKVEVTCEQDPAVELDFNLKYADTFIGQQNSKLICQLDTIAGKIKKTSFVNEIVPAGKSLLCNFDNAPAVSIKQINVDVTWDYVL